MEAEQFRAVLGAVRDLVRKDVVPREDEIEERDQIPAGLRRKAADMGLFGFALPECYGGLGLSVGEDVRLAFELGHTTPAIRSLFGTNNGIAGQVLVGYGTEEQRERWLPALAAGEKIASFALTAAEAGSDPSGMTATAARDGDDYVINGTKRFITNAPVADVFVVFARTHPEARGTRGISALLVESGTPGLTVGPRDHKNTKLGPSCAKLFRSEMAGRVAGRAVRVHGGAGYVRGVTAERLYRDARLFRIYEGTSEVRKRVIARQLLRSAR